MHGFNDIKQTSGHVDATHVCQQSLYGDGGIHHDMIYAYMSLLEVNKWSMQPWGEPA